MKRFLSLLLVLMLLVSVAPAVHAYSGPASSSNIDDHFYINAQRWTDPIKSTLAREGSGYTRVEYIDDRIVIEQYDSNLNYTSGQEIALELPLYGGVYLCDDYNFLVVGQENTEEDDSKEVFRIIRYSKDWERQASASIYGANTTVPFDAGCLRFARSGDILYIRTSHEMYADENGTNHQSNVMIAVSVSDMTVTDQLTEVLNSSYGYVSHSFNQFLLVDGSSLLAVDHGDYYPRSVVLFKYGKSAGQEAFYGTVTKVNALPIAESTGHYNDTGVSVGGFDCSSSHYLIAGNSADQSVSSDLRYEHRNIFVTATPKNNLTDEATAVHWLTDYSADDDVTLSPPYLVKIESDSFLLIWTENDVLTYCFLDGEGKLAGDIRTGEGALSDCVPILDGDRVLWYVTNNSAPVFYQIDLNDSGEEPHTHSYTAVVTEPTCTADGYTTYTCECGDSYTGDTVSATGHSYSSVVTAPTCTADGYTTYTCSACGDSYTGDTVEATGHTFEVCAGIDPTCTEDGMEEYACVVCWDESVTYQEVVPATGHSWDDGVVTREATEEEPGIRTYTCKTCGETRTEEIPALEHVHSYTAAVTAPTCTEEGFTTYTCTCGDSYVSDTVAATGHTFEVCAGTDPTCTEDGMEEYACVVCWDESVTYQEVVPATGHSWDDGVVTKEATEEEDGTRLYTCETCGTTREESIPALNHTHSYTSVVTEPTCTEAGYTTYTCTCGDTYTDDETAALGHDEVPDAAVAATCTESGLTEGSHCDVCGEVLTAQEEVPAAGHSWDDGVVAKEPTEKETGIRTYTCETCGTTRTEEIPVLNPTAPAINRISGENRSETALAAANALKDALDVDAFDTIIIASGTNFADALTGSYLAAREEAPILLYTKGYEDELADYVAENLAGNGQVYILGGTTSVPEAMENALAGFRTKRLAGDDRFETNLQILREAGVATEEILVCTAYNFADSLSSSAVGLPILLVGNSLNSTQKDFLADLNGNDLTIIGGVNSVSKALETALEAYGDVSRIAGDSREETSVAVAERFFDAPGSVVLAYSRNFPDGLCGGPLSYALGAPLILTASGAESAAASYVGGLDLNSGLVLGGTNSLPDASVRTVFNLSSNTVITEY